MTEGTTNVRRARPAGGAGRAARFLLAVVVAAGLGTLPAWLSSTGTLMICVAGMTGLGVLVVRRTLRVGSRIDANLPRDEATFEVGGRLRVPRALFYLGTLTVGFASLRPVGGLTVSEILFVLAFLGAVSDVARGRQIASVPSAVAVGTAIFVLGGALSTAHAVDQTGTVLQSVHGAYVMLLWLWTAGMVLETRRHIIVAITLWTVSIALDGMGAIAQLAGLHVLVASPEGHRMTGFTDHPNDLGAACGVALVPAMMIGTLAVSTRRALVGVVGWVPAAFIVVGLVLAGSVAGMAAALVAAVLWFSSPGVRTASRVAVVSLLVLGALIVGFAGGKVAGPSKRLTLVTNSSSTNAEAGSGEERIQILRLIWPRIQASPVIGAGLDTASATVQIVAGAGYTTPYLTHGAPLAAWYEAGFFGLVGLLLVFAGLLGAARRANAGGPHLSDHLVGWSLSSAVVGFAIYQLSAPLVFQQYGWLTAVLLVAWSRRPYRSLAPGTLAQPPVVVGAAGRSSL